MAAMEEKINNNINESGNASAKKDDGGIVGFIYDTLEMLAVAIALVLLVMTFFVRHSPVQNHSMKPTIIGYDPPVDTVGDVVLLSNFFYTPKTGDIVVIQRKYNMSEPLIKRVIAVGGDKLEINFEKWEVRVNGVLLEEDYINKKDRDSGARMASGSCDPDGDGIFTYEIPKGEVFVMGDNRNHSDDSRAIGCIDERYIVGRVFFRIWPFARIGAID